MAYRRGRVASFTVGVGISGSKFSPKIRREKSDKMRDWDDTGK